MRVAIMGAGGIGGYVGGRLAEAGLDVTLIARGPHLDALKKRGLTLDTPDGEIHLPGIKAVGSPAEVGEVDLILFTVKMADTDAAAASLSPMLAPQTRILTVQNGIDSREMIEAHTGPGRVAEGIIYLVGYIREPGVIWYPGGIHQIVADPMDGDPVMAKVLGLSDSLVELDIAPTDNPRQMVWGKFVNLAAGAGATSIARSTVGRMLQTPELMEFLRALSRENVAVARAEGLDFPDDQAERMIEILRGQPQDMKSSMLVDLEAGKPIELPWLSGRVVALAEKHGLDVPANRAVVAALAPHVNGAPPI